MLFHASREMRISNGDNKICSIESRGILSKKSTCM